jgi:hypothetical protein
VALGERSGQAGTRETALDPRSERPNLAGVNTNRIAWALTAIWLVAAAGQSVSLATASAAPAAAAGQHVGPGNWQISLEAVAGWPGEGVSANFQRIPEGAILNQNQTSEREDLTSESAKSSVPDVAEARSRYFEDARSHHIALDRPQYTNAPWSEVRLRAAALKGDGLAASLCSGSNALQEFFWLSLAATNGWIPAQVGLAKRLAPYRVTDTQTGKARLVLSDHPFHSEAEIEKLASETSLYWRAGVVPRKPEEIRRLATNWWNKARRGLPKLKEDAAHGKARAIYALALLHGSGDLVESNSVLFAESLRIAAVLGLAPAQADLAWQCEWHLTNHVEAGEWYYRAATQGLMAAQAELSSLHEEPSEFHFDPRFQPKACERARWDFEVAAQPTACSTTYQACNDIAELYLGGLGVESNAVEAVRWYRRATDMGIDIGREFVCGRAEYGLALCYFGGDGVPQDDAEGLRWIQRAKDRGKDRGYLDLWDELQVNLPPGFVLETPHRGYLDLWEELQEKYHSAGPADDQDSHAAYRIWRKNAAQGKPWAQLHLGLAFRNGKGVERNPEEAARWFRKAAQQGDLESQFYLGLLYDKGEGVPQDYAEALKWYSKAANQGGPDSQNNLGLMYRYGRGVPEDYVEAYKWYNLAAAQGDEVAIKNRDNIMLLMTPWQIAEGQRLARDFKPSRPPRVGAPLSPQDIVDSRPAATGTGFFITEDGFLICSAHVVEDAAELRLVASGALLTARVVRVDATNDLALLKADGRFSALPLVASRSVRLGATVATVGFPNPLLQGFAPKLAKGEIAALSGAQDDPTCFQISVPLQPGNSGGALLDEHGNVVGVVSAKLSVTAALTTSGALPENVNYAVKSSLVLGLLQSVPEILAKLKEPNEHERKFEDVAKSAEQAAALVLVY